MSPIESEVLFMKKGLTEIVFIMDRSGSMSGLESDTIGSFNSIINKEKEETSEALVSTVLFDDYTDVLYDRVDIQKMEPMTEKQYYTRGCTALLDAIGGAIHHIGNVHKYARDEDRPEKTLFVIITDGLENASKMYSIREVNEMIRRQQDKYGWEFLFLGANMDAVSVARSYGIREGRAATYNCDEVGIALSGRELQKAIRNARRACSAKEMSASLDAADWAEEIRVDQTTRVQKRRGR